MEMRICGCRAMRSDGINLNIHVGFATALK